ncbi:hypothetical protein KM043_013431 [Ampulex compressa]|nr:hypothetical protein KM043_013431 [Ampulex compressa]
MFNRSFLGQVLKAHWERLNGRLVSVTHFRCELDSPANAQLHVGATTQTSRSLVIGTRDLHVSPDILMTSQQPLAVLSAAYLSCPPTVKAYLLERRLATKALFPF